MKDYWSELKFLWNDFWWNYSVYEIHYPSGRVIRKSTKKFRFFTKKKNKFKKIEL